MTHSERSIFEQVTIESNDQSQDINLIAGVMGLEYYENIFSPNITAKMLILNTGDSIEGEDGKMQSVYNGLPLRGGERVAIKIKANADTNAGLDFSETYKDYLHVGAITNVSQNEQIETFTLQLVSRESISNETIRVPIKFSTASRIDVSVEKILKDYLKTEKALDIDKTKNKYGFIGNMRKPFSILTWLASKGVPEKGIAGFVFFQTQDGFHFKSIDNLINQDPKETYTYTERKESEVESSNDFEIIRYSTDKNQNLMDKLRLGTYSSFVATFDPSNSKFNLPQNATITLDDFMKDAKNLGQEMDIAKQLPKLSDDSSQTLGNTPSRLMSMVLDKGIVERGIFNRLNADPLEYQAQSIMRYNQLFTQEMSMKVPLNTNLRAGDVIECLFPKVTSVDGKGFDEQQSGSYLIKSLCHRFTKELSETDMVLVRDTYGMHGQNNDAKKSSQEKLVK